MNAYGYSDTFLKRGKQIDKVYEHWSKACDAYVKVGALSGSGSATRWLKKLRDYLDKEFSDKKGKANDNREGH